MLEISLDQLLYFSTAPQRCTGDVVVRLHSILICHSMEMRSQLHTLVILIQRKNRDGRVGAPQDQADCF